MVGALCLFFAANRKSWYTGCFYRWWLGHSFVIAIYDSTLFLSLAADPGIADRH